MRDSRRGQCCWVYGIRRKRNREIEINVHQNRKQTFLVFFVGQRRDEVGELYSRFPQSVPRVEEDAKSAAGGGGGGEEREMDAGHSRVDYFGPAFLSLAAPVSNDNKRRRRRRRQSFFSLLLPRITDLKCLPPTWLQTLKPGPPIFFPPLLCKVVVKIKKGEGGK